MNKITIIVPQKPGDNFGIGWDHRPKAMSSAYTVLRRLERLLTRGLVSPKTSIVVKYDRYTSNETLDSNDVPYLMYATSCFLEDYLATYHMKKIEDDWDKRYKERGGDI